MTKKPRRLSSDSTMFSFHSYKPVQKVLIGIAALIFFLYIAFPFYWIIVTSFKQPLEIYDVPPKLFPSRLSLENYVKAFREFGIGTFIKNSLIVTVITVIVTTIISMCAAYALTRLNFKGKKKIQSFLSMTQMFPVIVLLVPLYIMCVRFKMYNSLQSLLLP